MCAGHLLRNDWNRAKHLRSPWVRFLHAEQKGHLTTSPGKWGREGGGLGLYLGSSRWGEWRGGMGETQQWMGRRAARCHWQAYPVQQHP